MTFAALVIEHAPLDWPGLGAAVGRWLQDAGLYALLWLAILGLAYLVVPEFRQRSPWKALHSAMAALTAMAAIFFAGFLVLLATQGRIPDPEASRSLTPLPIGAPQIMTYNPTQRLLFSLAGLFALLACALPILRDLAQNRLVFRRIWAIARVSIKEAWSRGIVWVCLMIPLLYLYADWYISAKPEDQLRNRIGIAYFSMATLFILSSVLLGAFSIPADLKSQNIFTIVTKPVERYEIVLGRFVGYGLLLFGQMAILTGVSYIYVRRGMSEQAREESYHARVPLFGSELYFHNTGKRTEGENVGREYNYRSYIHGIDPQVGNKRVQYAVWAFDKIPAALVDRADDAPVRLEFAFDIFRTTSGLEDRGVYCSITFARGDLTPDDVEKLLLPTGVFSSEYNKRYQAAVERNKKTGKRGEELEQLNADSKKAVYWDLFNQYGIYQLQGIGVTDYHTQFEEVPAKVFKTFADKAATEAPTKGEDKPPLAMQVFVNVENDRYSRSQRVGMAKADLYLLVEDRPFWINFAKGAFCIYLLACLVLGLALVCSTYLTGIVSLLMTALLCIGGLFLPFIKSLAEGRNWEGGPAEAGTRLFKRQSTAIPLDNLSADGDVIRKIDSVYRWWLRFIMSVIPDVGQLYPKDYVANGFDITWGTLLLLNFLLPVAGYLLPCMMLAYYLMKSREIANP
jgi:ABC-type transport system involved in multi-copper enzyme maturation permease subunit